MKETAEVVDKAEAPYKKHFKPVTEKFLQRISNRGQVKSILEINIASLKLHPSKVVKLLFYEDSYKQFQMMVGIGRNKNVEKASDSEDEPVKDGDDEDKKNKDSIYTLTIALDTKFVQYMEDANFIKPEEAMKNLDALSANENFIKVLTEELS